MNIQLPFPSMLPESNWRMPTDLPDLVGRGAKSLTIDCETSDPNLKTKGPGFIRGDAFVAGYAVKADGFCQYFPVRHLQGENLPPYVMSMWLAEQLRTDIPKRFANGLYDLEAMWHEGIQDVRGKIYDVQVAEPLIDEETSKGYSLEALSLKYLGEGKQETLLKDAARMYGKGSLKKGKKLARLDAKSDLWAMPAHFVGPYAEGDVINTDAVFDLQEKQIDSEGLRSIFELETSLIPILLQMRIRGVRVDVEGAHRLAHSLTQQIDALSLKIKEFIGFHVNVDSSKDLARVYEIFNRKFPDSRVNFKILASGNRSFDKEWLSNQTDPLSELIQKKRKLMTMRDDFVLGDILGEQVNGRIHCQFHQLRQDDKGTRSGRFSSTNPNLQQVPARDEYWAPLIRSLFLGDEGMHFMKADVSQQEPRLLLHYASICGLSGAAEAVQTFRANPKTDYHTFTAEVCNAHSSKVFTRKGIKGVNLGIMYAMGLVKLCRQIGVSVDEGVEILKEYHKALPFVRGLSNKAMEMAEERGYIRTILGRIRRFNLWEPIPVGRDESESRNKIGLPREQAEAKWKGRRLRRFGIHKALNSLIQGSAADQIKLAMHNLFYNHKKVPHLQVHDELGASIADPQEGAVYKREMECAIVLQLPVVVDAKYGRSWGEADKEILAA